MPSPDMETLIRNVTAHVSAYMSRFDPSHDYAHVARVVRLAQHLSAQEQLRDPRALLRPEVVTLGALLHDVGDHKYLGGAGDGEDDDGTRRAQTVLEGLGADAALAGVVQRLVNHVSWSAEMRDPEKVRGVLRELPELAVVQDADRLDAIGAVGIARCFAYSAAVGRPLDQAVQHFEDKLLSRGMEMKTATARAMAEERSRRLREFRGWWEEETGSGSAAE